MKELSKKRILEEGEYIVKTGATVRSAGAYFEISKSTIHKDMAIRLKSVDRELYEEVRKILEINKEERHIRGGLATREKFIKQKELLKEVAITEEK